jgi:hypothetical protein
VKNTDGIQPSAARTHSEVNAAHPPGKRDDFRESPAE